MLVWAQVGALIAVIPLRPWWIERKSWGQRGGIVLPLLGWGSWAGKLHCLVLDMRGVEKCLFSESSGAELYSVLQFPFQGG